LDCIEARLESLVRVHPFPCRLSSVEGAWMTEFSIYRVGDKHSAMTYMVSGATALNVVLSHPDVINTTGWTSERMREEIESQFAGWDPRSVPDRR
jgi:hypothetical protein